MIKQFVNLPLEENNQREKEDRGVEVVVVQQERLVVVDRGQHLRRKDGIQRHKHGRQHSSSSSDQREVNFTVNSCNEPDNHHKQCGAGERTRRLAQQEVSKHDVEHQRETSSNIVWNERIISQSSGTINDKKKLTEGNLDILKTKCCM